MPSEETSGTSGSLRDHSRGWSFFSNLTNTNGMKEVRPSTRSGSVVSTSKDDCYETTERGVVYMFNRLCPHIGYKIQVWEELTTLQCTLELLVLGTFTVTCETLHIMAWEISTHE